MALTRPSMLARTTLVVSVVIPARNESDDVGRAIHAVIGQSFPLNQVEVVVVDGDSADDTTAVATKLLTYAGFKRWAVVQNPGGSTPSNLNRALEWARGDIIVRVDARSAIPPDYLRTVVGRLEHDTSVAVVGGSQVAISRDNSLSARSIARALNNAYAMGGSRYRRGGAQSGTADTVYLGAFRRQQLVEAGGWNQSFPTNQDFELNRRMSNLGDVWFEAGLPVGYIPRGTLRQIASQYHRFGQWKVRYWRATGDKPVARQIPLVAGPSALVFLGVYLLATGRVRTLGLLAVGGIVSTLALDHVGQTEPAEDACERGLAATTNALIGISWWSGIVRELARRPNS